VALVKAPSWQMCAVFEDFGGVALSLTKRRVLHNTGLFSQNRQKHQAGWPPNNGEITLETP